MPELAEKEENTVDGEFSLESFPDTLVPGITLTR